MMNNNIKVSIIIPIFNAERFIDKCLNSIINQTYKNIEILCIDDGSTDNSRKILNSYKEKDERIKVIFKCNSGVSDSRNIGIEKSSGKYICFVDSDDYLDENYIEQMIYHCPEYDLIKTGYKIINNSLVNKISIYDKENFLLKDITYPLELNNFLVTFEYSSCWARMIKRNVLIENNIRFKNNLKYSEDMLFSFECYINSKKSLYLKNYGYNYVLNENSAMQKKNIDSYEKRFDDNLYTTNYLIHNNTFTSEQKEMLYFRTIISFNKTIQQIFKNYKYNDIKKFIKIQRIKYDLYFRNVKIRKYSNVKNFVTCFLLKYKLNYLYYLLIKIFY